MRLPGIEPGSDPWQGFIIGCWHIVANVETLVGRNRPSYMLQLYLWAAKKAISDEWRSVAVALRM